MYRAHPNTIADLPDLKCNGVIDHSSFLELPIHVIEIGFNKTRKEEEIDLRITIDIVRPSISTEFLTQITYWIASLFSFNEPLISFHY